MPSHPTLRDALEGFGPERLARLFAARPDLVTSPPPSHLGDIANRAARWQSQQQCVRRLDSFAHCVLEALCILPNPVTAIQVTAFLGPDAPEVAVIRALDDLTDLALAMTHPNGGGVSLVGEARSRIAWPARLGSPLVALLDRAAKGQLEQMARQLGIRAIGTKGQLVKEIAGVLGDADRCRVMLGDAPAGVLHVLRHLSTDAGPLLQLPQSYWYNRSPGGAYDDLHWLLSRGFLIQRDHVFAELPLEIGLALRGGRPFPVLYPDAPPVACGPIDPRAVEKAAGNAGSAAVAGMLRLLDACDAAPPVLLSTGGVGTRDLRRLAKSLDADVTIVGWIVELAVGARLLGVDLDTRELLPTTESDGWRAVEPASQWTRLVEAWWSLRRWPSVAGVEGDDGKLLPALGPQPDTGAVVEQRRSLVAALGGYGTGGGAPGNADECEGRVAGDAVANLRWRSRDTWSSGPASVVERVDWILTEAIDLGVVVILPAMADADPATSPPATSPPATSPPVAAPMTPRAEPGHPLATVPHAARLLLFGGNGALEAARAILPRPSTAFTLQADLTAVAPGTLRHDIAMDLALMSDVESRGAATVHRFTEPSIRRAIDAGLGSDAILGFLQRHADRGVPQALSYLVADVARRHGSLRIGAAACYIRSDEPALVTEVMRTKKLAKLGLHAVAPTVAISSKPPKDVISALRTAGFLPAQEDPGGAVVLGRPEARRVAARPPGWETGTFQSPYGGDIVAPVRGFDEMAPAQRSALVDAATLLLAGPKARAGRPPGAHTEPGMVRSLMRTAASASIQVDIGYNAADGTYTERTIAVYGMTHTTIDGYCFLRGEDRVFAVNQIVWAAARIEDPLPWPSQESRLSQRLDLGGYADDDADDDADDEDDDRAADFYAIERALRPPPGPGARQTRRSNR